MRHDVKRRALMGTLVSRHSAAMIAATLAAIVLWGAAPAAAQEDNFTENLFTSLGLMPPPQAEIEYRERAPLVVPPTGDVLPPPRDGSEMASNPAWPKDPDVAARKKAVEDAKKPVFASDRQNTRALTPSEVVTGRRAGANLHTTPVASGAPARDNWIQPRNLEFFGWGNSQTKAPLAFDGEPERQALSEPPPGYQTPAPGAAYGVVAERPEEKMWRLPSWFDRTQSPSDRN